MLRRRFGQSQIQVSVLGFGAGGIDSPSISDHQCEHLLNSIVDAGINFIDTARSYGSSEERIGKHLKNRRNELVLSTKIGYGIEGYQDWSPPIIEAGIDHALRLLQTDWIDIVHLHSCPVEILERDGIIDALQHAVDAGKVRVAAYSGDNDPLRWALDSAKFSGLQMSINICDQYAIPLLNSAQERGTGIIVKRALANAPWRDSFSSDDNAAIEYKSRWNKMALPFQGDEAAEIALRFAAFLPEVHTCLVGSTNLNHIYQNIRTIEHGPLPESIESMIRSSFLLHGKNWIGQI